MAQFALDYSGELANSVTNLSLMDTTKQAQPHTGLLNRRSDLPQSLGGKIFQVCMQNLIKYNILYTYDFRLTATTS